VIRLVTLDLYATLCYSVPSRNERLARLMCELGYGCTAEDFLRPNVLAEEFYTRENGRVALHTRTQEEQEAFYAEMFGLMLREAGLRHDPEFAREVRRSLAASRDDVRYRLYDDVVPALEALRERRLAVGVVSNTSRDVTPLCEELDVCARVDFVVSSCLVGCEKPGRLIFETALGHAGVEPAEAVHVGDQPRSDALGARAMGMHALLLDRDDLLGHEEYERIRTLAEVPPWIDRRHS
jgi:HAD superfamily hydrolase (TIGR01509 family)